MADYTLSVDITGDSSSLNQAFDDAVRKTETLGGRLQGTGQGLIDAGKAGMIKAAATVAGFGKIVSGSMSFESNMRKAAVLTNGSYDDLKSAALDMAKASVYSTGEVAAAMAELGAKGFDASQAIDSMPGILAAAAASGEDLGLVSEVVTSALNAFGIEAKDSGHVADVLAEAANKSAAGVDDMGYAFKYAAPGANALGIGMEELAAATGIMTDQGLKGMQAGTTLRMAFASLAKPTSEASRLMEELGFSAIDADGNFKSLGEIVGDLNTSFEGMTDAQKQAALVTIFGTEATNGMNILMGQGKDKLDEFTQALINSDGASQEAADGMLTGWGGAVQTMKSTLDVLARTFTDNLAPALETGAKWVAELATKFTELSPEMQRAISGAIAIGAGLMIVMPLVQIFGGYMIKTAGQIVAGFAQVGGIIAKVAEAFAVGTAPVSVAALAIVGLIAMVAYTIYDLWTTSESFRNAVMSIWTSISAMIQSAWVNYIQPVFNALVWAIMAIINSAIIPLYESFKKNFEEIVIAVSEFLAGIQPTFDQLMQLLGFIVPPFIAALGVIFASVFGAISGVVSVAFDTIGSVIKGGLKVLEGLINFISGVFTGNWDKAWSGVQQIFAGVFEGLVGIAKAPINAIIGLINGFIGGINQIQIPDWVPGFGGMGINLPMIPYLARGTDDWYGGFARMNEGGRGEMVLLPSGSQVIPHDVSMKYARESAKANYQSGMAPLIVVQERDVYIDVEVPVDGQALAKKTVRYTKAELDRLAVRENRKRGD